jgi:hypothetical protein
LVNSYRYLGNDYIPGIPNSENKETGSLVPVIKENCPQQNLQGHKKADGCKRVYGLSFRKSAYR